MIYRVIRTENGSSTTFDFDDIEDAKAWVRQEQDFDEDYAVPLLSDYQIVEVE